jgi:hypothetical protein
MESYSQILNGSMKNWFGRAVTKRISISLIIYSPFLTERNQAKSTSVKKFQVTVYKQFN